MMQSSMHGVLLRVQQLPLGQIQLLQTVRHSEALLFRPEITQTLNSILMVTCTLCTLIGMPANFSTQHVPRLALPIHLGITVC
jgi:hypothetical protein